VREAGFDGFTIKRRKDVFSDTPQQSRAISLGTVGVTFLARKP